MVKLFRFLSDDDQFMALSELAVALGLDPRLAIRGFYNEHEEFFNTGTIRKWMFQQFAEEHYTRSDA